MSWVLQNIGETKSDQARRTWTADEVVASRGFCGKREYTWLWLNNIFIHVTGLTNAFERVADYRLASTCTHLYDLKPKYEGCPRLNVSLPFAAIIYINDSIHLPRIPRHLRDCKQLL